MKYLLSILNALKSPGPGEMQSRILKEMVGTSAICLSEEFGEDWRKANTVPSLQERKER